MSHYYRLKSEDDQNRLIKWWDWLGRHRGERAELKRASSGDEVLMTQAFRHFLTFMPDHWSKPQSLFDSAMVAGLLARVEEADKGLEQNFTFAGALGKPRKGGDKPVMSELRFLQLQKSRDPEEFYRRMARALALLRGKAPVLSLADGILHWMLEYRRVVDREPMKRLAVRWANDYYSHLKD
jgi:CRISPR system Cascade subunit CasB